MTRIATILAMALLCSEPSFAWTGLTRLGINPAADPAVPCLLLLVLMLLPIAGVYWARSRALKIGAADPTGAWFSYLRTLNLSTNFFFIFWVVAAENISIQLKAVIQPLSA